MNRLSLWYRGLGRNAKIAIVAVFTIVVLVVVGVVGYLVLVPQKVKVKYGTIVRDPVDGHVWSDNTKTAMVDPDKASKYRVEYVDKLSPEHEKELADQKAQLEAEKAKLEESKGLESVDVSVPAEQFGDIQALQQDIQSMGSEVVSGLEMAGQISATKSQLVDYRNQIAAVSLPAQLEPFKQQIIGIFDMYIQACDLYLQGIASADMTYIQQASDLASEATAKIQGLVPQAAQ